MHFGARIPQQWHCALSTNDAITGVVHLDCLVKVLSPRLCNIPVTVEGTYLETI